MKWFENMKIGARLGMGFALAIAAGLAAAVYASIQLDQMSTAATWMSEAQLSKLVQLSSIVRNAGLLKEDALKDKQAEKQRIVDSRAKIAEVLQKLGAAVDHEKGRALLRDIESVQPQYTALIDKALESAITEQDDAARDILTGSHPGTACLPALPGPHPPAKFRHRGFVDARTPGTAPISSMRVSSA